jgi:hypothetical protein
MFKLVKTASLKEARMCCLVGTDDILLIYRACAILKLHKNQNSVPPLKTKQEKALEHEIHQSDFF